ncbi:thiamine biosynthesis lipoprotein [Daejeonella rubra]|uniref:FAD:protein FMN transferase n=1 Tax=Daejeonella rubra TaxID=990371 RepID=A0A1G9LSQ0_9SPHI|nr:FAD:protein FMN transferase [Daejeonella rubra]SDL65102.1 thiamine biosynthesis lipoprotein [Daejeonella rubra]
MFNNWGKISFIRFTRILSIFFTFTIIGSCSTIKNSKSSAYKIEGFAQGTSYQITYYAERAVISSNSIDQIFSELDSSLSIYKPYSLINQFNNSENGILMDEHLFKVVQRSLKIWKESNGVFDISILPIVEAWGFGAKKHSNNPTDDEIARALSCSGSDKLRIEGKILVKTQPCLKIDVNGIAQGYSVDVIASYLESKAIKNYLIEIGGEIRVKGRKQPGNQVMRIGIEQPAEKGNDEPVIQKVIELRGGAITTSGNYRKFIQNGSKKLSHLMDPKTGRPIDNEMISVTVRSHNAMSADGYDNVLIGMGIERAFAFLKKHKELDAYFIYRDGDGVVRDTASVGFFR